MSSPIISSINFCIIYNDISVFADHFGNYKIGDSIVIGENENDFLVIEYLDGDKVYVPVYKLNLIQKHAEGQNIIKVDNLKTQKFDNLKSKAKSSVKKLAFDLLELQAKRKMKKGFSFSAPDHLFKEFFNLQ